MSIQKLQITSAVCLVLSMLIELADGREWLDFGNPELPWGTSLGLILAALSFNIKVIRDFGATKRQRANSQRFALLLAIYAFLVFGLEML